MEIQKKKEIMRLYILTISLTISLQERIKKIISRKLSQAFERNARFRLKPNVKANI